MAESIAELRAVIRSELAYLWGDFWDAVIHARCELDPLNEPRGWSIGMLNVADRIGTLTKVVGPCDWEAVQVGVLLDGWWEAVHARVSITAPDFDRDRAQELRDKHSGFLTAAR